MTTNNSGKGGKGNKGNKGQNVATPAVINPPAAPTSPEPAVKLHAEPASPEPTVINPPAAPPAEPAVKSPAEPVLTGAAARRAELAAQLVTEEKLAADMAAKLAAQRAELALLVAADNAAIISDVDDELSDEADNLAAAVAAFNDKRERRLAELGYTGPAVVKAAAPAGGTGRTRETGCKAAVGRALTAGAVTLTAVYDSVHDELKDKYSDDAGRAILARNVKWYVTTAAPKGFGREVDRKGNIMPATAAA